MPNFSGVWDLKDQVQAIAAGRWTGLPLPGLYAWGNNYHGAVGDGTTIRRSSPVQIGSLTTWSQVAGGGYHTAALKSDGTLWTWGRNNFGQLGQNTTVSRSSPIQIGALTTWSKISGGRQHTAAIKTDGTLWTWGAGGSGRLGDGTNVDKSSPVQVGALANWSQVSAGNYHNIALKTDGTLWAWGAGSSGRLGDGTVANKSSPVQLGALTTWAQVSAGEEQSAAVKTDGTLWAWGNGYSGTLGNNNAGLGNLFSSPIQIGALTNWSKVAMSSHAVSVKTDGTIWAWGRNAYGQIGDNTVTNRSSPVQIGSATNWTTASVSKSQTASNFSAAADSDGKLYLWGANSSGQLGDGTVVNRSSPVQVPSSPLSWLTFSAGGLHTVAVLES